MIINSKHISCVHEYEICKKKSHTSLKWGSLLASQETGGWRNLSVCLPAALILSLSHSVRLLVCADMNNFLFVCVHVCVWPRSSSSAHIVSWRWNASVSSYFTSICKAFLCAADRVWQVLRVCACVCARVCVSESQQQGCVCICVCQFILMLTGMWRSYRGLQKTCFTELASGVETDSMNERERRGDKQRDRQRSDKLNHDRTSNITEQHLALWILLIWPQRERNIFVLSGTRLWE